MKERSIQQVELKKNWELAGSPFHRFLEWLDQGKDSGGETYLEMRRRLVLYFDRKSCRSPDELADETLNRVARRLEEEGTIHTDSPAHYCYIVARFVMLETVRAQRREASLDDPALTSPTSHLHLSDTRAEGEEREQRLSCLDRCMAVLEPRDRELIVDYYHGAQKIKIENRKAMAERMGLTQNALCIRACRIRDKLNACLTRCLSN